MAQLGTFKTTFLIKKFASSFFYAVANRLWETTTIIAVPHGDVSGTETTHFSLK